jgi:hypothetical protein
MEKWTKFFDMSSGGEEKEDFAYLFVNLPINKAVKWFEKKFGHNPNNVTCPCCGKDYSIDEIESNPEDYIKKYEIKSYYKIKIVKI